jgi:hypothetical protein
LKLYHGSNEQVIFPDVTIGRSPLDFGRGFYVTTSLEQAKNWAARKAARSGIGVPIINIYESPDDFINSKELLIKQFFEPSAEWLDFVVVNRNEEYRGKKYDIVCGPVADDNVIRVIRMYMNETYDKEEAIKRFKTEKLDNQILFATEKSLGFISFMKAEVLR